MKLRTQLLLAFLVLAVLPLASIVLYSYVSSLASFHRAVNADAEVMASAMASNLEETKLKLGRQLGRLGGMSGLLPSSGAPAAGEGDIAEEMLSVFGEDLSLFEMVELIPEVPDAPEAADADEAPDGRETSGLPGTARERREVTTLVVPDPEGRPRVQILDPEDDFRRAFRIAKRRLEAQLEGRPEPGLLDTDSGDEAATEQARAAADEARAAAERAQTPGERDRWLRFEGEFPLRLGDRRFRLRAAPDAKLLVRRVLDSAPRASGEIPFAISPEGELYPHRPNDAARLREAVTVIRDEAGHPTLGPAPDGWIVASQRDSDSGLLFGVARPVSESLAEMRRSAARNLGYGLALIGLALLGMLPISSRISKNLLGLTRGAHRLASGDLTARVPVRSKDEFGQLARAFNVMAVDLSKNQERLVEQERLRKEEEIERRVLELEHRRKTDELEEARRFQLSMLPAVLPDHPEVEISVFTRTATEVGGDYYDFQIGDDGALTTAIGDATGHGARAGTMVAVIKSLFSSHGARAVLKDFLSNASMTIKRMGLGRIAMALALVRIDHGRMTVSSAGMPPVLLYRAATGEVREILLEGMPLGGIAGFPYREEEHALASGDALLLMTDGLPEVQRQGEEPMGYDEVHALFASHGHLSPHEIITFFDRIIEERTQGSPLEDDVTFVVMKIR